MPRARGTAPDWGFCDGENVNTMVDQSGGSRRGDRVAREVGTEGKLGRPGDVRASPDVEGPDRSGKLMASNLTSPGAEHASHDCGPNGNLRSKITVHGGGEILELKNTINRWSTSSRRSL